MIKFKESQITFLAIALSSFRIFTNLPMLFVKASGTGAPLSSMFWGILFFIAVLFLSRKNNFNLLCENKFGLFFKYLVYLVFLGYLFIASIFYLREISEFTKLIAFPTSPLWFIMLFFVIAAATGALGETKSIILTTAIFVPFFIFVLSLLILSVIPQCVASNLFPVLGTGLEDTFGKGFWGITMYSDVSLFLLLCFSEHTQTNHRKGILWGVALGILINIAIVFTFTAKFPYPISQNETYPLYLILKEAYFGRFFHRIDAVILVVSSIWGMISLSFNFCLIAFIFRKVFNVLSRHLVIFLVSVTLFFLTLIFPNVIAQIKLYSLAVLIVSAFIIILSKGKENIPDEN